MLYEEDIILHGSTIVDSDGLLHGKYKSKHKSKSGKWVYVYDNAKKAVVKGAKNLLDSNETVDNSISSKEKGYNSQMNSKFIYDHVGNEPVDFDDVAQLNRLKNKTNHSVSSKSYDKSRTKISNGKVRYDSKGNSTTKAHVTLRKKGSIHKGYDATVRALKGLVK